ncbi:hypothetical protein SISNIDRAFT_526828 [Sistotremastrum niveocremeum HHB9708]|uniref:Uncharacterized protein n=1 Tax=Sistotremastrum niveocremeum HHB9708 TaxID=1314777 RepID=A0A164QB40_9AGAM|nr:hypothetical protein SISNIDRAFT_526828 [Sistotremastrum niveocremeum HHB9708]
MSDSHELWTEIEASVAKGIQDQLVGHRQSKKNVMDVEEAFGQIEGRLSVLLKQQRNLFTPIGGLSDEIILEILHYCILPRRPYDLPRMRQPKLNAAFSLYIGQTELSRLISLNVEFSGDDWESGGYVMNAPNLSEYRFKGLLDYVDLPPFDNLVKFELESFVLEPVSGLDVSDMACLIRYLQLPSSATVSLQTERDRSGATTIENFVGSFLESSEGLSISFELTALSFRLSKTTYTLKSSSRAKIDIRHHLAHKHALNFPELQPLDVHGTCLTTLTLHSVTLPLRMSLIRVFSSWTQLAHIGVCTEELQFEKLLTALETKPDATSDMLCPKLRTLDCSGTRFSSIRMKYFLQFRKDQGIPLQELRFTKGFAEPNVTALVSLVPTLTEFDPDLSRCGFSHPVWIFRRSIGSEIAIAILPLEICDVHDLHAFTGYKSLLSIGREGGARALPMSSCRHYSIDSHAYPNQNSELALELTDWWAPYFRLKPRKKTLTKKEEGNRLRLWPPNPDGTLNDQRRKSKHEIFKGRILSAGVIDFARLEVVLQLGSAGHAQPSGLNQVILEPSKLWTQIESSVAKEIQSGRKLDDAELVHVSAFDKLEGKFSVFLKQQRNMFTPIGGLSDELVLAILQYSVLDEEPSYSGKHKKAALNPAFAIHCALNVHATVSQKEFPSLISLNVSTDAFDSMDPPTLNTPILRELRFRGASDDSFLVCFENLVKFELQSWALAPETILEILAALPSVEHCEISNTDPPEAFDDEAEFPLVVLRSLKTLRLHTIEVSDAARIIRQLDVPSVALISFGTQQDKSNETLIETFVGSLMAGCEELSISWRSDTMKYTLKNESPGSITIKYDLPITSRYTSRTVQELGLLASYPTNLTVLNLHMSSLPRVKDLIQALTSWENISQIGVCTEETEFERLLIALEETPGTICPKLKIINCSGTKFSSTRMKYFLQCRKSHDVPLQELRITRGFAEPDVAIFMSLVPTLTVFDSKLSVCGFEPPGFQTCMCNLDFRDQEWDEMHIMATVNPSPDFTPQWYPPILRRPRNPSEAQKLYNQ